MVSWTSNLNPITFTLRVLDKILLPVATKYKWHIHNQSTYFLEWKNKSGAKISKRKDEHLGLLAVALKRQYCAESTFVSFSSFSNVIKS